MEPLTGVFARLMVEGNLTSIAERLKYKYAGW